MTSAFSFGGDPSTVAPDPTAAPAFGQSNFGGTQDQETMAQEQTDAITQQNSMAAMMAKAAGHPVTSPLSSLAHEGLGLAKGLLQDVGNTLNAFEVEPISLATGHGLQNPYGAAAQKYDLSNIVPKGSFFSHGVGAFLANTVANPLTWATPILKGVTAGADALSGLAGSGAEAAAGAGGEAAVGAGADLAATEGAGAALDATGVGAPVGLAV